MRIVHLSDIHLSKSNYEEFKNTYREALIRDLLEFNSPKKIDIIVITGDLVDKGGNSLYEIEGFENKESYPNLYNIFEEIFINPIIKALNFSKENFLFVPGNHDIDESQILLKDEYEFTKKLDLTNINEHLKGNSDFKYSERIRKFKEFEETFHKGQTNYQYTPNQSIYNYSFEGVSIGFLLINDSWRCRSQIFESEDKLMLGVNQFYNGLNNLKGYDTKINIALLHHPIDVFREVEELQRCLNVSNISFYLYGHYHSSKFEKQYQGSVDNCFGIRGRSSLNKINEKDSSYHPGYQIIDLDFKFHAKITAIHYRCYHYDYNHFDYDNYACKNGIDKGRSDMGMELRSDIKQNKHTLIKSQFES